MQRTRLTLRNLFLWMGCAALTVITAAAASSALIQIEGRRSQNSEEDKSCGQPACYAGEDGNKSCYICEYGKPTQHTKCVPKGSKQDHDYAIIEEQNKNKDQCPKPDQYRLKDHLPPT